MKVKLDFLGQCHNPNAVRGADVTDRIEVVLNETTYGYSLDSDKEEVAKHATESHLVNSPDSNSSELIADVRAQLGLAELKPVVLVIAKKPRKPAAKTKSNLKRSSRKSA